jgi:membrane-associated PAP2 superfamily phosphatase
MICKHCGNEVGEGKFCRSCGAEIEEKVETEEKGSPEVSSQVYSGGKASAGWAWIGVLVPVLGLVLYFILRKNYPLVGKKLLIGFIIGFVLSFISLIYSISILPAFLEGLSSLV